MKTRRSDLGDTSVSPPIPESRAAARGSTDRLLQTVDHKISSRVSKASMSLVDQSGLFARSPGEDSRGEIEIRLIGTQP